MPVNILPILIPIILLYALIVWFLGKKNRKLAWGFIGISMSLFVLVGANLDVKKHHSENMHYTLSQGGLDLTSLDGKVKLESAYFDISNQIQEYLKKKNWDQAQVEWDGYYDFGKLSSYQIITIDGIKVDVSKE